MYLQSFRSKAAIVSEKSIVFTFSYRKAYVTKFDLVLKQVKVDPSSSFRSQTANTLFSLFPIEKPM